MSMGYVGFHLIFYFVGRGQQQCMAKYGGGRCMAVHWYFYQHLGMLGVHSHDPLGSKDGIWGDDQ